METPRDKMIDLIESMLDAQTPPEGNEPHLEGQFACALVGPIAGVLRRTKVPGVYQVKALMERHGSHSKGMVDCFVRGESIGVIMITKDSTIEQVPLVIPGMGRRS
jgi:hypothetical protein